MELMTAFIAGLALASLLAFLVASRIVRRCEADAASTAKMAAETAFLAERSRLETELQHAGQHIQEMRVEIEGMKAEAARNLQGEKDAMTLQMKELRESCEARVKEERELSERRRSEELERLEVRQAKAVEELRKRHSEELARMEENRIKAVEDLRKRHSEDVAVREEHHAKVMDDMQKRFDETMAKVSAQLRNDTDELLKTRQLEFSQKSNESIGNIVNPLKENIDRLRKAMEDESKEQAERNGEMRERIRSLMQHSDAARKSADELAAALRHGTKVQGDWGETLLEELLNSQGLTKGVHYDTQEVLRDAAGNVLHGATGAAMRPDVILHLDERREVIIDSKVSLTAYVNYANAENDADRQAFLKAHIDSVKKHVKELSAKNYASYVKPPKATAGYVIMFVPMAAALWTALNAEPDLWRWAADQNVYIADEQSLYGALKIVNLTWTQVAQAQNHEKVFELANEMIDRVGIFMEHYGLMGKAIEKLRSEYDSGMVKLAPQGQSIVNTSKKLLQLGAKNSERHPLRGLEQ